MVPALEFRALQQVGILFQPGEDGRAGTESDFVCLEGLLDSAILHQIRQQKIRIERITVDDAGRGGLGRRDGVLPHVRQLLLCTASQVTRKDGPGDASTTADEEAISRIVVISRQLHRHFQRDIYSDAVRITIGVLGLEHELEFVGISSIFWDTELLVLFHGPVVVLVQRDSEDVTMGICRTRQDGAFTPFGNVHGHRGFHTVDYKRDRTGLAVLRHLDPHRLEIEPDGYITVSKAISTGLGLHAPLIDNDGIIPLGDEVKALDNEIAVLLAIRV